MKEIWALKFLLPLSTLSPVHTYIYIASKGRLYARLKTTGRKDKKNDGRKARTEKMLSRVPEAVVTHAPCVTRGFAMEMRP